MSSVRDAPTRGWQRLHASLTSTEASAQATAQLREWLATTAVKSPKTDEPMVLTLRETLLTGVRDNAAAESSARHGSAPNTSPDATAAAMADRLEWLVRLTTDIECAIRRVVETAPVDAAVVEGTRKKTTVGLKLLHTYMFAPAFLAAIRPPFDTWLAPALWAVLGSPVGLHARNVAWHGMVVWPSLLHASSSATLPTPPLCQVNDLVDVCYDLRDALCHAMHRDAPTPWSFPEVAGPTEEGEASRAAGGIGENDDEPPHVAVPHMASYLVCAVIARSLGHLERFCSVVEGLERDARTNPVGRCDGGWLSLMGMFPMLEALLRRHVELRWIATQQQRQPPHDAATSSTFKDVAATNDGGGAAMPPPPRSPFLVEGRRGIRFLTFDEMLDVQSTLGGLIDADGADSRLWATFSSFPCCCLAELSPTGMPPRGALEGGGDYELFKRWQGLLAIPPPLGPKLRDMLAHARLPLTSTTATVQAKTPPCGSGCDSAPDRDEQHEQPIGVRRCAWFVDSAWSLFFDTLRRLLPDSAWSRVSVFLGRLAACKGTLRRGVRDVAYGNNDAVGHIGVPPDMVWKLTTCALQCCSIGGPAHDDGVPSLTADQSMASRILLSVSQPAAIAPATTALEGEEAEDSASWGPPTSALLATSSAPHPQEAQAAASQLRDMLQYKGPPSKAPQMPLVELVSVISRAASLIPPPSTGCRRDGPPHDDGLDAMKVMAFRENQWCATLFRLAGAVVAWLAAWLTQLATLSAHHRAAACQPLTRSEAAQLERLAQAAPAAAQITQLAMHLIARCRSIPALHGSTAASSGRPLSTASGAKQLTAWVVELSAIEARIRLHSSDGGGQPGASLTARELLDAIEMFDLSQQLLTQRTAAQSPSSLASPTHLGLPLVVTACVKMAIWCAEVSGV